MKRWGDTLEFVVNSNTVISLATLIAAVGSIIGVIRWGVKYVDHAKEQDEKLKSIQKEQKVICYGIMSCLRGLREQGCDGPVDEALKRLESHLNEAAHND